MAIVKSIKDAQKKLLNKELNALDILNFYKNKIEEDQGKYNDILWTSYDLAEKQAKIIEEKIKNGEKLGKLAGAVFTIKDNILIKNYKATAGSKILDKYIASYNATVIERLLAEDAMIIAKTNMDELACGSTNETSYYGVVKNPINPDYVPGGSSGGAAVSVKANHCLIALGTDTGGSVRQPASFCSVQALKPSYGRISRSGIIAMASSFDQVGIIAKNYDDIFLTFEVLNGKDLNDLTTIDDKFLISEEEKLDKENFKIAYSSKYFELTDKADLYFDFIEKLKQIGFQCDDIDLIESDLALNIYYILQPAELSSNLSRLDGIRYSQISDSNDLETLYLENRSQGFGEEIKRRIILGTFVLSADYYDAYYKKAYLLREYLKSEYEKIFANYDLLLIPTTPSLPFKLNSKKDPLTLYKEDIFTVLANVIGTASYSFPIEEKENDFTYSIQILSPQFKEINIYKFLSEIHK